MADSDFAVNEIHENYKIPTDKISKIYLGADNLWSKSSEPVQNLDFDRKTILILGRWQKYKNIHTILKMIKYTNNSQILACNVIVLGKKVESEIELFYDSIKGFPIDKLQIIDYLSDSQMKYLFSRVDIIIHPSVNEGFGIPAFEAFGEGAVLIVHEGTPASDYLRSFKGVLAEDLTDLIKTESVVSHALSLSRQDANIRRIYLSKMGMTWNEVGRIYMKFFSNLVLDNYNKISN